jgi:hypothetical protein
VEVSGVVKMQLYRRLSGEAFIFKLTFTNVKWHLKMENFKYCLVQEDELIMLLSNEIAELDRILVLENFRDCSIKKELYSRLGKLHIHLMAMEHQFSKMKNTFVNL